MNTPNSSFSFSPCVTLNLRYEPLIPQFVASWRGQMDDIASLIARREWAALERVGHNLHGTGTSYGLHALSTWGALLEEAASVGDTATAIKTFTLLREYLRDLQVSYRNTILFVDDQSEILSLLKRLFAGDEYICLFCQSGAAALELLETQTVDVIVSDLVMPDMGGLELLSQVRERFPETVRIVLSGQSQVPSILAAINTGQVFRYLTKPWRIDAHAREIIAEAVAHANSQNGTLSSFLHISPDALCQLLEATGRDFVVVQENRVLLSSPAKSAEFAAGNLIQDLDLSLAHCVPLGSHCAWIWAG